MSVRRTGDTTHRRQVLRAKVVLFRTASTEFKDMSGGPSALDVLKGSQPSRCPHRKISMVDQLALECLEKTLGNRVIPTIAFAAHTLING